MVDQLTPDYATTLIHEFAQFESHFQLWNLWDTHSSTLTTTCIQKDRECK